MIRCTKSYQKVNRICKYCGKNFKAYYRYVKKGLGIYCSVKCCNAYKNKFIIKNKITGKTIRCKLCNEKFWITPAIEKRNVKCCSKKCSLEYKRKHEKKTKCVCRLCKKNFKTKNSQISRKDRPSGKYCSKKCMDEHRQRRKTIKCKKCGKIFIKIRSSKNMFCNVSCRLKWAGRTTPEKTIARKLRKIKCSFEEQKLIRLNNKKWTHPDFYISPNICLYIDGVYWHSFKDTKTRDKRNNKELRNKNFRVYRIKDTTIKKGEKSYINKLLKIAKIHRSANN